MYNNDGDAKAAVKYPRKEAPECIIDMRKTAGANCARLHKKKEKINAVSGKKEFENFEYILLS